LYLTLTQACGCILDRCKAGDWVVEKVFEGPRKNLLLSIDYSTEKQKALEYIKKYRIAMAPAIIFLDAQGGELWRAMGELDLDQVEAKLREFGE
jgi:thiol:disulfide interchange protein